MTMIPGSLFNGLDAYLQGKTNRKFALLIIDEQGSPTDTEQRLLMIDMIRAINLAQQRAFEIVVAEINPTMLVQNRQPTSTFLTNVMITTPHVFFKVHYNAFGVVDGTGLGTALPATSHPTSYPELSTLDGLLRSRGVNELVVMGRMNDRCVKFTVEGGREGSSGNPGPELRGALDHGYQVWASHELLFPRNNYDPWQQRKGVHCYQFV